MLEFYPNISLNQGLLQDGDGLQAHQCNGRPDGPVGDAMDPSDGPEAMDTSSEERTDTLQDSADPNSCRGCGRRIRDRFLVRVSADGGAWHERCARCSACGAQLARSCYCRGHRLYCKQDYDRMFGAKCSGCGGHVHSRDLVMRAAGYVWHVACFACGVCGTPLRRGERFALLPGPALLCTRDLHRDDLAADQEQHLLGIGGGMAGAEDSRPRDGRRGPKRPRTILTSAQRRQFKASFEVSPKPCRKVREALAKETGLSVRVVQVWFQNQRAKMKKIQRKAKQEPSSGQQQDKSPPEVKEEIKQESPGPGGYLTSGDGGYSSGGRPLNPNMPYSPDDAYHGHSGDSFCSSDISLDGSTNFDQLDEATSDTMSLQNLELHQHGHGHQETVHPPGGIANPIDKLYLMQNSYFSTEQ